MTELIAPERAVRRRSTRTTVWRLFVGADGLSSLADGIGWVLVPLAALRYTGDPAHFAALTMTRAIPVLFFSLASGVLADRYDRRRLMISATLVRAGGMGAVGLAMLSHVDSVWWLYALSVLLGFAQSLYDTSATSAAPSLVDPADLAGANSTLRSVQVVLNGFCGPPIGGALYVLAPALGFGLGSAVSLGAALALGSLRRWWQPPEDLPSGARRLVDPWAGFRWILGSAPMRLLALGGFVLSLGYGAVFAVFALFVAQTLHGSPEEYGLVLAIGGVAAFAGAMGAARLERAGAERLLAGSLFAIALAYGLIAIAPGLVVATAGLAVGSMATMVWNVWQMTARQLRIPPEVMGRAMSAFRILTWAAQPVGALLAGALAGFFDLRSVIAVAAAAVLVAALALTACGLGRTVPDAD